MGSKHFWQILTNSMNLTKALTYLVHSFVYTKITLMTILWWLINLSDDNVYDNLIVWYCLKILFLVLTSILCHTTVSVSGGTVFLCHTTVGFCFWWNCFHLWLIPLFVLVMLHHIMSSGRKLLKRKGQLLINVKLFQFLFYYTNEFTMFSSDTKGRHFDNNKLLTRLVKQNIPLN